MDEKVTKKVRLLTWQALPDISLEPAGPLSVDFLARGVGDSRSAGRHLATLPYGRTASRSDFTAVLREGKGTCSTKHALLAALAREQDIALALTLGIYEMQERNTPGVGVILDRYGLDIVPEAHCYVIYDGVRIDVTRSGVDPAEPWLDFLHEETIAPEQIGEYKIALHRRFMQRWASANYATAGGRTADALWRIREECIAALAQ